MQNKLKLIISIGLVYFGFLGQSFADSREIREVESDLQRMERSLEAASVEMLTTGERRLLMLIGRWYQKVTRELGSAEHLQKHVSEYLKYRSRLFESKPKERSQSAIMARHMAKVNNRELYARIKLGYLTNFRRNYPLRSDGTDYFDADFFREFVRIVDNADKRENVVLSTKEALDKRPEGITLSISEPWDKGLLLIKAQDLARKAARLGINQIKKGPITLSTLGDGTVDFRCSRLLLLTLKDARRTTKR